MTTDSLIGFSGLAMLVLINIAVAAYTYGKLSQKVEDFCQRVDRLEKIVNGKNGG